MRRWSILVLTLGAVVMIQPQKIEAVEFAAKACSQTPNELGALAIAQRAPTPRRIKGDVKDPGILYDQPTARAKLAELMGERPGPWRKAIRLAAERGWKPDFDHVFYWERGTKKAPVRTENVGLQETYDDGTGRVVVMSYSPGADRFYVSLYTQNYSTGEEFWHNVEFQPTADNDGNVTFSQWIDFTDTHGHDSAMECTRPGCGPISFEGPEHRPRLRRAAFQDACQMHPACATMRGKALCLWAKWGSVWRHWSIAMGTSLAGCWVGAGSFYTYVACVGRGGAGGFAGSVIWEYYYGDACS